MQRADEEFAKSVFDEFLRKTISEESIIWTDGNQNEAPDYFLAIGTKKYVVEVTMITDEAANMYWTWYKNFTAKVQSVVSGNNTLCGTYVLSFSLSQETIKRHGKQIRKKLVDFIGQTSHLSQTELVSIIVNGMRCCSVQKTRLDINVVILGGVSGTGIWESDAKELANSLLRNRISEKIRTLTPFTEPKILLLIDQFPYVSPDTFAECAKTIDLTFFHSVFMIIGSTKERQGVLWHSSNHSANVNASASVPTLGSGGR
jgi:hypothetical protein